MNWTEILFSVLGVILTGLASWATTMLIKWLNTKIKNKELAAFAATILLLLTVQ